MLWIYRFVVFLLLPMGLLRLRRGQHADASHSWRERLGKIALQSQPSAHPRIWIHAASLGEVNAVKPLVEALLQQGHPLVMSTMTHSGMRHLDSTITHPNLSTALAPIDTFTAVRRWLDHARPDAAIIVETELWPEMLHQCHTLRIPVIVVNARLTAAAARRYRWIKPLLRPLLAPIKLALTQSPTDSQRLIDLGLRPEALKVVGNLKFDLGELRSTEMNHAMQWLAKAATNRHCWVAGSTRPGEEEIILKAHKTIQAIHPEALLILAPRHVERTTAILEQIKVHGLHGARLSKGPQTESAPTAARPEVVVLDEIGTLRQAYALASVCFVGGSLVPVGGHNLIEPAALAKTVISGPHLDNQTEAAQCLEAHKALIRIDDADQLAAEVSALFTNPGRAQRLGAAAHAAISGHRGSLQATLQALEPVLTRNGLQT